MHKQWRVLLIITACVAMSGQAFASNISNAPHIFADPAFISYTISNDQSGGDCSRLGIWNHQSRTCTLTGDVYPLPANAYNGPIVIVSIDGNGITIDGNGYSIVGSGSDSETGIWIMKKKEVTVKNLAISGCAYAITMQNRADKNSILNNTLFNNMCGISIAGWSKDNNVTGNTVTNNDIGVYLGLYADQNAITGNTILYGNWGIMLYATCSDNILTGNILDRSIQIGPECYNNVM